MYKIKLDKEREIKFNMRAISRAEKLLGQSIIKSAQDPTMEVIAGLTLAGISHEKNSFTIDEIMDLIDEHTTIQDVTEQVLTALSEAMGTSEGGDEKNAQTAK